MRRKRPDPSVALPAAGTPAYDEMIVVHRAVSRFNRAIKRARRAGLSIKVRESQLARIPQVGEAYDPHSAYVGVVMYINGVLMCATRSDDGYEEEPTTTQAVSA